MRTRYASWSLAALLLGGVAVGYAAGPAKGGASDSAAATVTAKSKAASTRSSSGKRASAARAAAAKRHPVAASGKHKAAVRSQTAPTPQRISEIQNALAREGTYQGNPNGNWDATTAEAMRQFQIAHNLNPTGKLDAPTLQKLGLGSDVAGRGAPLLLAEPQASVLEPRSQAQHP